MTHAASSVDTSQWQSSPRSNLSVESSADRSESTSTHTHPPGGALASATLLPKPTQLFTTSRPQWQISEMLGLVSRTRAVALATAAPDVSACDYPCPVARTSVKSGALVAREDSNGAAGPNDHPESGHWSTLSPKSSACRDGVTQAPIPLLAPSGLCSSHAVDISGSTSTPGAPFPPRTSA